MRLLVVGVEAMKDDDEIGKSWHALTSALNDVADAIVLGDSRIQSDVVKAEGLQYLIGFLASGAITELENHDPAYPQLAAFWSAWLDWGGVHPDSSYLYAPVHSDYSYRIFGTRGTAKIFTIEIYRGDWAYPVGTEVANHRDEFVTGPDGEIEVFISREQREGNWIGMPEGPGFVLLRHYWGDWSTERLGHLDIEREGATYPPPPVTAETILGRLQNLVDFVRNKAETNLRGMNHHYEADPGVVPFGPLTLASDDQVAAMEKQTYGLGRFEISPGEACLLEVTPPKSRFWQFMITDQYFGGFDWIWRQTSLTGDRAHLDSDGVFRAVISIEDPGVQNWLDTGGHTIGGVLGRYQMHDHVPIPTLKVVPVDKVLDHLPPDTPRITKEERSAFLRERMLQIRRRQGLLL